MGQKWVVVRSSQSGVWLGRLVSIDTSARMVTLENAIRAWSWNGALACSSLAVCGPDKNSKFECAVSNSSIWDVCEVHDATDEAVKRWQEVKPWAK